MNLAGARSELRGAPPVGGMAGVLAHAAVAQAAARPAEPPKPFEVGLHVGMDERFGYFKPDTWTVLSFELLATQRDFRGTLEVEALPVFATRWRMGYTRRVVLPKGTLKKVRWLVEIPWRPGGRNTVLKVALFPTGGGRPVYSDQHPIQALYPHQTFIVLLGRNNDEFPDLNRLKWVRPNTNTGFDPLLGRLYQPVKATPDRLPDHVMGYESVSHLLWDRIEAGKLSGAQQQALVDWVRLGGTLIVGGGHQNLMRLRNSFLEPLLPVELAEPGVLTRCPNLNQRYGGWTWRGRLPVSAARPLAIIHSRMRKDPARNLLREEGLPIVTDRPLGRGRVVWTAFSLRDSLMRKEGWTGLERMFERDLLSLPPAKVLAALLQADPDVLMTPSLYGAFGGVRAARRWGRGSVPLPITTVYVPPTPWGAPRPANLTRVAIAGDLPAMEDSAAQALTAQSGIAIPSHDFVAGFLIIYVLAMVPLTFTVFRLVRRVEWAWAVMPLLAVGFAVGVHHVAGATIGSGSTINELAVADVLPDCQRAHVVRYLGVYSARRAVYAFESDNETTLYSVVRSDRALRNPRLENLTAVWGRRPQLGGFRMAPRSLSMIKVHEMLDLGGTFLADLNVTGGEPSGTIENNTAYDLADAVLVGPNMAIQLGALPAGTKRDLDALLGSDALLPDTIQRSERFDPAKVHVARRGEQSGGLISAALRRCGRQWSLVGWIDRPSDTLAVRPEVKRHTQRILVVARLAPAQQEAD